MRKNGKDKRNKRDNNYQIMYFDIIFIKILYQLINYI